MGRQIFAAKTAAPPANISAAVGTVAKAPPFRGIEAGTRVVMGMMPEVNGESATDETPAKAGACVEADGLGVAVVLEGLRTLNSYANQSPKS